MFSKWNYGTEGRGFESLQPHHFAKPELNATGLKIGSQGVRNCLTFQVALL